MQQLKAQSAVEMLTTYSWALLIIGFLVVIAFIITFSTPQINYIGFTCSIQPQIPCSDALLSSSNTIRPIGYRIEFTNNLQTPMVMGSNSFNAITIGNLGSTAPTFAQGNCYPSVILPGGVATCNASIAGSVLPSTGTRVNMYFVLTYGLCQANGLTSCSANNAYKSTGYSIQAIAPAAPTLYTIGTNALLNTYSGTFWSGNSIQSNTIITVDGNPYATGYPLLLPAGNYIIYAQPVNGYLFQNWGLSAPATATNVINSSAQYTFLYVASSANILVNYTNTACGGCYNIHVGNGCNSYVCCPGTCAPEIGCGLSRNKCV